MAYSVDELKSIAREIVRKSKSAAHVDTGRLKRSISFVVNLQGVITFTEVFYGQFGDNSDLEENIKSMWPNGFAYNLIYTDDDGKPYQLVKKTASGRSVVETKAAKKELSNAKKLIENIKGDYLKNNREEIIDSANQKIRENGFEYVTLKEILTEFKDTFETSYSISDNLDYVFDKLKNQNNSRALVARDEIEKIREAARGSKWKKR